MTRKEAVEALKDIVSTPMLYSDYVVDACRVALASLETDEAYQLEYEQTTKHDTNFVPIILTTRNGRKVDAFLYKPQCLIVTDYITVEASRALGCSFEEVLREENT